MIKLLAKAVTVQTAATTQLISHQGIMRFFFFLTAMSLCYGTHCTFIPPQGWEIAQLTNPSPHIKIGFLGQGSGAFRPSINLAIEEDVDISLKEYTKAVKEIHAAHPTTFLRDLGVFPTSCGEGKLLEITNQSAWGEIKVLQVLLVSEQKAYILTAAVLKEDFFKFQKQILQSFRSLQLTDDLFSLIPDQKKRAQLISLLSALRANDPNAQLTDLQNQMIQHADLGPYWAFLVVQEGLAKKEEGD